MEERRSNGAVIAIDLCTAYDLVDRKIVWKIMQRMEYPETFIEMLRSLYQVTNIKINFGAEETGKIKGNISLRQGCPLSMLLFDIYIEPLINRLEKEMIGLPILDQRIKITAFVDDVNLFVQSDNDILTAGKILDEFCKWTGCSPCSGSVITQKGQCCTR